MVRSDNFLKSCQISTADTSLKKNNKMRNIFLVTIAICLASCGNTPKTATTEAAPATEAVVATPDAPKGKIDPVCEMAYDKAWTEQTIYNGDTISFCSETCKKAFLGRPTKYIKPY